MSMSGYDRECSNCGRYLSLDDEYLETLNDYGIPVPICTDCDTTESWIHQSMVGGLQSPL